MAIKLDMSKFKKVSSDKHTTTMKHDDGHVINIAHAALSPKMRSALAQLPIAAQTDQQKQEKEDQMRSPMAGGGEAEQSAPKDDVAELPKKNAAAAEKGATESGWQPEKWGQNIKEELGLAEGGKVSEKAEDKSLADRIKEAAAKRSVKTEQGADKIGQSVMYKKDAAPNKYRSDTAKQMPKIKNYAEGDMVTSDSSTDSSQPDLSANSTPAPQAQPTIIINNGQQPGAQDQQQQSQAAAAPPAPEQPKVDPSVARQRQIYNSMAPEFSQIGPNGEPPHNFDANIWHRAEELYSQEQQDQQKKGAIQSQQQAMEAAARQRAGLPPAAPTSAAAASPPPMQAAAAQPQVPPPAQMPAASPEQPQQDQQQGQHQPPQPAAPEQQAAQPQAPATPEEHQQAVRQELSAEDQAWQQDLANQHVTPKTYGDLFAQKSTLGKIGAVFGLMIGGGGSALAGDPSATARMMQTLINNDLEAQKQSKANAQNFLKLNQQNLMNQAQVKALGVDTASKAYALSKMQMNRAALHTLTQQAQQYPMGSPQRQAADQTLALLYQAVNNDNFNIADRAGAASALANFGNGGGNAGTNPEQSFQQNSRMLRMGGQESLAKDLEEKHYPGLIGRASVPLTTEDRNQINAGVTFQNQLDRFIDWTKSHSGDLNPSDIKEGKALAAGLQGAYRQATHGGVYKTGEQDFISQIIDSDPTKFFNKVRVLPSLHAVKRDSAAQLDTLVKGKGFQGYSGAGSQSSSNKSGFVPKSFKPVQ